MVFRARNSICFCSVIICLVFLFYFIFFVLRSMLKGVRKKVEYVKSTCRNEEFDENHQELNDVWSKLVKNFINKTF